MGFQTCLDRLFEDGTTLFTFQYGDMVIDNVDEMWNWTDISSSQNDNLMIHKRVYSSPDKRVEVVCEMTEFLNSNVLEWVLYVENVGESASENISELWPLHTFMKDDTNSVPCVLHSKGANPELGVDNYALMSTPLKNGKKFEISDLRGGKTSKYIPFFNLRFRNSGYIGALGWPGRWLISAEKKPSGMVELKAGMPDINISLKPGERIRSPKILLMPWKGDWIDAHNCLRRHNLDYNTPQYNGRPVPVPVCHEFWGGAKKEYILDVLDSLMEHEMKYDVVWMDAGWYGPDREVDGYQVFFEEDWGLYTGDWRVNHTAHPEGLRGISDAVHERGMKYLLWFEPERVVKGTPISKSHPEWIIGDIGTYFYGDKRLPYMRYGFFDFGNEDARNWMIDTMSSRIEEEGIDIFRHDTNWGTEQNFWEHLDPPSRKGMTQIKYVQGLLEFWDELRRRHPNLILDIVQRGDLETISRSVDLTRSDQTITLDCDPIGNQIGTQGLFFWRSNFSTGVDVVPGDTYGIRSGFGPGMMYGIKSVMGTREQLKEAAIIQKDYPFEWGKKMLEHLDRARPYYYGDYYPLTIADISRKLLSGNLWAYEETVCSLDRTIWFAYQFNRTDLNEGMVMVLKRPSSTYQEAILKLRGLKPDKTYKFENVDTSEITYLSGQELLSDGLKVSITETPGSRLYFYKMQ